MWYHYLGLVVGLWLIATSLYNIVVAGNRSGWVINGISTAIGGGLAMWAYSGLMAPPAIALPIGGRRRY
jgi:hypothetical protein